MCVKFKTNKNLKINEDNIFNKFVKIYFFVSKNSLATSLNSFIVKCFDGIDYQKQIAKWKKWGTKKEAGSGTTTPFRFRYPDRTHSRKSARIERFGELLLKAKHRARPSCLVGKKCHWQNLIFLWQRVNQT